MELAYFGGERSIPQKPTSFEWIIQSDWDDIFELLRSQQLSGFLAQSGESYLGGQRVRLLEQKFVLGQNSRFAVSFNSWTSGLEAIFVSLDFEKGSEVIVTPWTMSATVAAIVLAGYEPVFCDIDTDTFNLDINKVSSLITSKTRAVCAVDIFGLPANWPALRKIADEHGLKLIADSAQAPSARIDGQLPVYYVDAGGYSFNRHKHLQTGEGGIVVTNDKILSERLQALRNHGEVSAPNVTLKNSVLIGHNWRLGEIEAAIAVKQLDRLELLISSRRVTASKFIAELSRFPGISIPLTPKSSTHDYYILGMHFDAKAAGFSRDFLIEALQAEGVDFVIGQYCQLHRLPAYRKYRAEDMSVTDRLNREQFLGLYLCGYNFDDALINQTIAAFEKIWKYEK